MAAPAHANPIPGIELPGIELPGIEIPGIELPGAPAPQPENPAEKPAPTQQAPEAAQPQQQAQVEVARPAEIRPGVPSQVTLRDGTIVPLSAAASNGDLVAQLQALREQLTEQGMALLNQLMSLLPGGGGPNTGQLILSVNPSTGITPGSTVAVAGSGYRAGENIYVTQTIAKPASGYPSTYADAQKVTADASGKFATTLKIVKSFSGVNCLSTQCYVASFTAFPKLSDRSQDQWTAISLAGGSATPGDAAPNAQTPEAGTPETGTERNGSGPSVSVSKANGLNPAGDTISVHGSGFSTSGPGVYVGIAQTDQFSATDQSSFDTGTVWVSPSKGNLRQDGSFDVQLPVKAKFGRADCTAHTCAVYTFAAHGSSDRSQDTATPIAFTGGPVANGPVDVPADGGQSRDEKTPEENKGPSNVAVALSTTTIAPTGSTPITVSGSGFATDGPGVYVGLAETGRYSTTDANSFGAVAWVPAADMSTDGSFSVTLQAEPVFASGNCIENACAIYTFAAHGSADRSQDTSTAITVSGSDAEKEAAKKEAAEKAEEEEAKKEADALKPDAQKGDQAADATASAAQMQHEAANNGSSNKWWPWALGGVALALAAGVGGFAATRRKS